LETNSLKKISWSLYKNFLISGKMFSTETLILPCVMDLIIFCSPFTKANQMPTQNFCQNDSVTFYSIFPNLGG